MKSYTFYPFIVTVNNVEHLQDKVAPVITYVKALQPADTGDSFQKSIRVYLKLRTYKRFNIITFNMKRPSYKSLRMGWN